MVKFHADSNHINQTYARITICSVQQQLAVPSDHNTMLNKAIQSS